MNSYKDWMMTFYQNRMMNYKNGKPLPDGRSLLAKRKLAVAQQKGEQTRKNERRLAVALKGSPQRKINELRLALALSHGLGAKKK